MRELHPSHDSTGILIFQEFLRELRLFFLILPIFIFSLREMRIFIAYFAIRASFWIIFTVLYGRTLHEL